MTTPIGNLRAGDGARWVSGRFREGCDDRVHADFVLQDESGSIFVRCASETPRPPLGAWLRVRGSTWDGRYFQAERMEVLARPGLLAGEAPEWRERPASPTSPLGERARLLAELRASFAAANFLEIEAPTLVRAPGQELHLQPFTTELADGKAGRCLYLITSPEYSLKRLLACGHAKIYSLGRSYRNGRDERSPVHVPEFTLLEWYRLEADLRALASDLEGLLPRLARAVTGGTVVERQGNLADLAAPIEWITVAEAFREYAAVDLTPYLEGADEAFLRALPAVHSGSAGAPSERADRAFFELLIERIEPRLGQGRPSLLYRYPARHAALAELSRDDPRVCERFELYVLGLELANAFFELTDSREQERRLLAEQAARVAAGGSLLPICEDFLRALRAGLPPCTGIALGVDRLHLLLSGAAHVDGLRALPFPASV